VLVPLAEAARPHLVAFGREMQRRRQTAGGLMRSAYGKARGLALRLSLVLEFLWWCGGADGMAPPPREISVAVFLAAARLVSDYLMPMAERVYGDAAAPEADRNAATLARRGDAGAVDRARAARGGARAPGAARGAAAGPADGGGDPRRVQGAGRGRVAARARR
jgi:Protein of unknown function (DUF3987)